MLFRKDLCRKICDKKEGSGVSRASYGSLGRGEIMMACPVVDMPAFHKRTGSHEKTIDITVGGSFRRVFLVSIPQLIWILMRF